MCNLKQPFVGNFFPLQIFNEPILKEKPNYPNFSA
jgi:hypothetical protein